MRPIDRVCAYLPGAWCHRWASVMEDIVRDRYPDRELPPDLERLFGEMGEAAAAYAAVVAFASAPATDSGDPVVESARVETVTTTQAAATLDVSDRRIRQLCEAGRLEAWRPFGVWRIPAEAVEQFKENHR